MMPTPVVSVIMPAYNAAAYLNEAVASVVSQTFTDWELWITNDGSTDLTAALISDWEQKDARIKSIHQDNKGLAAARNIAIKKSSGKYLAFIDADDSWLSFKMEKQLAVLDMYSADLVFSDAFILSGRVKTDDTLGILAGCYEGYEGVNSFLQRNQIPVFTVLVKKEVVDVAGYFNEDRNMQSSCDYHLWLKLMMQNRRFYGIAEPLGCYRIHPQSMSSADRGCLKDNCYVFYDLLADAGVYKEAFKNKALLLLQNFLQTEHPQKNRDWFNILSMHDAIAPKGLWHHTLLLLAKSPENRLSQRLYKAVLRKVL
jgi:teichuronic acid biosynthesis glycosyltransferase TuaG